MARTMEHRRRGGPSEPDLPRLDGPSPEAWRFFHDLIGGMRCGVLAIDVTGRVLMLNDVARRILDLDASSDPGLALERALAPHPQLVQVLRKSLEMTNPPNRAELELGRPGRSRKMIGFTVSPIRTAGEPSRGVAVFFRDLTQIEHRAEQERLKDRLAALGQMAASMAHEIRNPLASIEVSCGLLKRRLAGQDDLRALLDKVIAEVRRVNATVNSSLEYVRPVNLRLERRPLGAVLDEAIELVSRAHPAPGLRLERRYAADLPDLRMDRQLLRQAFTNLILNAAEAVAMDGTVTISADLVEAPPDGEGLPERAGAADLPSPEFEHVAVVRVADTGPGIRDEAMERLFYPFFTTKKGGSGVGLSSAKKIVDGHGGLIDAENAPQGGAVFTVRLPVILEPAEACGGLSG